MPARQDTVATSRYSLDINHVVFVLEITALLLKLMAQASNSPISYEWRRAVSYSAGEEKRRR